MSKSKQFPSVNRQGIRILNKDEYPFEQEQKVQHKPQHVQHPHQPQHHHLAQQHMQQPPVQFHQVPAYQLVYQQPQQYNNFQQPYAVQPQGHQHQGYHAGYTQAGRYPKKPKPFKKDNPERFKPVNFQGQHPSAKKDNPLDRVRKFLRPSTHILKVYKYVDVDTKEVNANFKVYYGKIIVSKGVVYLIDTLNLVDVNNINPSYIVSSAYVHHNNNVDLTINGGKTVAKCECFISIKAREDEQQAPGREN